MTTGKETVFRLLNGESVIGKLISETPDSYVVERPYAFQAFVLGTTPFSGREIVTLKDWLKYSTDNHIIITKNNVLAQFNPDPDIIKLYNDKKELDDDPSMTQGGMEDLYEQQLKNEDPSHLNDLMKYMHGSIDLDNDPEPDKTVESFGLTIPVNEDFLNDLMSLLGMYAGEDDINAGDDVNFIDEEEDKQDDPDEWGNHFRHWSMNPEDYL
tara:strand:+ start:1163 stop:1798 length:636 start_codon:yes stop_codon:yes gene_type:complete